MKIWKGVLCASLLLGMAGCGDEGDEGDNASNNAPETRDVTLNFSGQVNGEAFACGQTYSGVGTSGSALTPADFRFYLHSVELLQADGTATPLELADSPFQTDGLVLIDFEDKSGPCANGTTETNTAITGTAPAGDYTGVRFVLGVPFDLNHNDPTLAASPLNLTSMHWNWEGGYKFMRMDAASSGLDDTRIHLGSTGCMSDDAAAVTGCANENRPTVTLDNFDIDSGTIVADLGALLAGSDIDANTDMTAPGCMSAPDDPECAPIFERLGLTGDQAFFSAQ